MEPKLAEIFAPLKNYICTIQDFEKKNFIAKGGYGSVCIAQYKKNPSIVVALKEFDIERMTNTTLKYYQREVTILACYCNNPFIIRFVAFSIERPFFIATEYMRFGSLFHVLRNTSIILTPTDKTKIALGIIEGMIHLHSNNIIYRDLKSTNILLADNLLPKICDFGTSRALTDQHDAVLTRKVGTINWMAPELFTEDTYDTKADVYSFSHLLWEILTGKYPFEDEPYDPLILSFKIIHNNYRPNIPDTCNQDLANIIRLCWDKDPTVRPSFAELYEMFRDQHICFDGADLDAISQFFNEYPVSEEILQKEKTKVNQKVEIAGSPIIPEIEQQPKPTENERSKLNKTSSNYEVQIDDDIEIDENVNQLFGSGVNYPVEKEKKTKQRSQTVLPDNASQEKFRLRSNSGNITESIEKKRQTVNLKLFQMHEKMGNNKTNKPLNFDDIYDIEMMENQFIDTFNDIEFEKNDIFHKDVKLNNNIFAEFVDNKKLSRMSMDHLLTENCDNVFLKQKSTSGDDEQYLHQFKLNPAVYESRDGENPKSKNNVIIETKDKEKDLKSKIEFEFDEEDKEVETQMQELCGTSQILNVIKYELNTIEYDQAESFFNNIQLIINQPNQSKNKHSKMTDMLVYFLARGIGLRPELIVPLNNSELFENLPISKKPIAIASFIELFTICLLKDIDRFPIEIFKKVIQLTVTSRNVLKFIRFLEVVDNIIPSIDDSESLHEALITMDTTKAMIIDEILNTFTVRRKIFYGYCEFSLAFFSIYNKLVKFCIRTKLDRFKQHQEENETGIDDDYCHQVQMELITIALDSIQYSRKVDAARAGYNIILSTNINAIQLSEQNLIQLPLRAIVNQIQPKYTTDKLHEHTWCCGELLYESVSVFVRFQYPPCSLTLITNLFNNVILNLPNTTSALAVSNNEDGEIAQLATMVLCKIAKTKKGSILLIKNTEWLDNAVLAAQYNTHPAIIEQRLYLCLLVIITLFESHYMLRDELAKLPSFWNFLASYINLASSNLTQILRFTCLAVRRFSPLVMSTDKVITAINDSRLFFVFSLKIFNDLTSQSELIESAEYAIEIVDLIARATFKPSDVAADNANSISIDFSPYVYAISYLLKMGGVIAHKTIIASLSVFSLHPQKSLLVLKKTYGQKQHRSTDQANGVNPIEKILKKLMVSTSFDKYKVLFLEKIRSNLSE